MTFYPSKKDKGDYTIIIKLADNHYIDPLSTTYDIKLSIVDANPPLNETVKPIPINFIEFKTLKIDSNGQCNLFYSNNFSISED